MEISSLLMYMGIGVTVPLVLYWIRKGASREIQPNAEGVYTLRMPPFFLYGALAFGVILLIFITAIMVDETEEQKGEAILIVTIFCTLVGLPSFLYYHFHRLVYNDQTVTATSWLGKSQTLSWDEIESAALGGMQGNYHVKGAGKVLKVSGYLVGFKHFQVEVERKLKKGTA
ncbi:MAG: hypothetical protein AAFR61_13705 [Bacteroidota bacterium]